MRESHPGRDRGDGSMAASAPPSGGRPGAARSRSIGAVSSRGSEAQRSMARGAREWASVPHPCRRSPTGDVAPRPGTGLSFGETPRGHRVEPESGGTRVRARSRRLAIRPLGGPVGAARARGTLRQSPCRLERSRLASRRAAPARGTHRPRRWCGCGSRAAESAVRSIREHGVSVSMAWGTIEHDIDGRTSAIRVDRHAAPAAPLRCRSRPARWRRRPGCTGLVLRRRRPTPRSGREPPRSA